ncbi:hypothetical protein CO101_00385 [Candidatus Berkelbacteria bacterium CG_4_9_14_3_um_filter_39_23]|uniref:Uncharacterized protein n=2 Tax=Candidatus Berkelbacteria TaxID=1618330 RepID=A0A2M7CJB9_9BACT|nr:hypothetical protein [Candidatus Berkelbacteria bacterium]OIP05588.1 MAG: hypothetical protein AUK14_01480 [Candidatus Berkelbacteria bacterium CG2_30_39_44]PIR28034.1 MAG: hypothetical protein COV39_01255 [Candidatus Berkelbacteria bacterium CG11_big_fil_rev_8_21_14_0_20_40_23]PIV25732.1 MAG: hypothetical protein COS38_00070 [Candidatus Berkelbacteria bacterium CG03_land_8_20_14_0_80_40_36]PIX30574.1 MAG: hypothetical protein COZ62_01915 [Candidatus Berkelbacteria bacterium CG_4_8_14_3_um_f
MIITWQGGEKFTVKTKNAVVKIGETIKINDFEIHGEGEYEVGGVECQGMIGNIFVFAFGDIRMAYLNNLKRALRENERDLIGEIDILLTPVNDLAKQNIQNLEPKISIPYGFEDLGKFCQDFSCPEPVDRVKLKKADLPEKHEIIVLNYSK